MSQRAMRTIAALFGLSLLLTACDPNEVMRLVSDQLVEQEAAEADGTGAEQPSKKRRAPSEPAADDSTPEADKAAPAEPAGDSAPEADKSAPEPTAADSAPEADKPAPEAPADSPPKSDGGSSTGVQAIEKKVFDLLNATRREAGLASLSLSADISNGARDWSCDMARSGNFRHANLRSAGVNGENIAWGYSTAAAVHEGWMNSSGHRRNRMSASWSEYGIGVCEDDAGRRYYTERFR